MKPNTMWNTVPRFHNVARVAPLMIVLLPGLACARAAATPEATTTVVPQADIGVPEGTAAAEAAVGRQRATDVAAAEPAPRRQEPDTRPGIAVLPFAPGIVFGIEADVIETFGIGVQQILITELAQNTELRLVDRSVIRDIMAEQDLVVSGRVDPETAARIGRLVGARYVFAGSFHQHPDGVFQLDGRIVDAETSEVRETERALTEGASPYYPAILTMAHRMAERVNLPPLPSEVRDQRESRAATIPREAVILYSQAQFFQDRGHSERARQLYLRITNEFPQLTEAAEALRQIDVS